MFQEFKDAFTVTLAKRLTSPFMATFIFSWCVFNYDITLLIFSGLDWDTKVTFINGTFSDNWEQSYRTLVPLSISLFYVLVWPRIDIHLYKHSKKLNVRFKSLQKEMEDETPLTRDDENKLRADFSNYQNIVRREIAEKDARISELEARNKGMSEELFNKTNPTEETRARIQEENVKIDKEQRSHSAKKATFDPESSEGLERELEHLDDEIPEDIEWNENLELPVSNAIAKTDETLEGKAYIYRFSIRDDVRKQASLNGKKLEEFQSIKFKMEDIDIRAWHKLHELFYDKSIGTISDGEDYFLAVPNVANLHSLKSPTNKDKPLIRWFISEDPSRLSTGEIMDKWSNDFDDQERIMNRAKR